MTITLTWWMLPTIVTILLCGYALFIYDDGGELFSGMGNIMLLVPALFISLICWVIAAILK